MIRDAAFAMSSEQSLASPATFPATSSVGHLSTDYADLFDYGMSGGREQFIELEITETVDTAMTVALAVWPDAGPALRPTEALVVAAGHRFISQKQFLLADLTAGSRLYLPLWTSGVDFMDEDNGGLTWRWLNLFYLCTGTTAGKVTARLVDAITHKPRRFDANNLT